MYVDKLVLDAGVHLLMFLVEVDVVELVLDAGVHLLLFQYDNV